MRRRAVFWKPEEPGKTLTMTITIMVSKYDLCVLRNNGSHQKSNNGSLFPVREIEDSSFFTSHLLNLSPNSRTQLSVSLYALTVPGTG